MKSLMNLEKLCKRAETDLRMVRIFDGYESFQSLIGRIYIMVRSYHCTIYTDHKVIYYEPNFPRLDELKKIYPNYKLMQDNR